jgi:2-polyprenyl-3-methyl-5-hydroxy-6-metoxy-1,4-benzoquinol methylase
VSHTWQREVPEQGFTQRIIGDLGAALAAGGVVIGDRLGLYRTLAAGPMRPLELAQQTGTAARYVEEWLRGQAAGGYVEYDPSTQEYRLTPEQAQALADPAGIPGAFALVLGALLAQPRVEAAFRTGEGIGWHEHDRQVFDGWARLQESLYASALVLDWLPALHGVTAKLRRGATVADIACGHVVATILMAKAYPASRFVAFDNHPDSVATARARVEAAGLTDRITVTESWGQTFGGGPYDLVTTFDALHDQGDPVGLARHIHDQLAADGTWMIVEPAAGASVRENLTPIGRLYYALSIYLCVPNALAQEGGHSLGAQAGEEPIRRVVANAGFGHLRTASRTELTVVYEVRHA